MPVDYSNTKIYCIKAGQCDKIFIGATIKRLCERFSQHKSYYQKYMFNNQQGNYEDCFDILKYSDCTIQLLERVECKDKDELNAKLQDYLEIYKDKVINKPKERIMREPKPSNPLHKKRGRKPKVKNESNEISSDSESNKSD